MNAYTRQGHGGLEAMGTTWRGRWTITGPTQADTQPFHSFTPGSDFRVIEEADLHVSALSEEGRETTTHPSVA